MILEIVNLFFGQESIFVRLQTFHISIGGSRGVSIKGGIFLSCERCQSITIQDSGDGNHFIERVHVPS